jgi:hypothetical protein
LRQAASLRSRLGDHYEEAETLVDLGDGLHALEEADAAREAWQHALDLLQALEHPAAGGVRTKLAAVAPDGTAG